MTPDNCEPAGTIPRLPDDRRPGARRGTAAAGRGQGAQTRPAHAAVDARRRASEPPLGRAAATVAICTAAWKQGRILAMAKVPSRSAANALYCQMSPRLFEPSGIANALP